MKALKVLKVLLKIDIVVISVMIFSAGSAIISYFNISADNAYLIGILVNILTMWIQYYIDKKWRSDMNKFEEVDAKDIKSGSIEKYPDKFIAQVGNNKITVTKDGFDIEANSVKLDGKVSSQECIVFTNSGHTYHFKNVTDFVPTTTGFSFTYTGVATGVTRKANFEYTSVAGYALS